MFRFSGKVQRPFFSITSAKDHYEDFCFLNDGSVIALSGFNPKSQFTIIDLLLPPKVVITAIIFFNQMS